MVRWLRGCYVAVESLNLSVLLFLLSFFSSCSTVRTAGSWGCPYNVLNAACPLPPWVSHPQRLLPADQKGKYLNGISSEHVETGSPKQYGMATIHVPLAESVFGIIYHLEII